MSELVGPLDAHLVEHNSPANPNGPQAPATEYVSRVDSLFFKSFEHFRLVNAVLSLYSFAKIVASLVVVIVDLTVLGSTMGLQDAWCLCLIPVSILQLFYYRLMSKETNKLESFLHLAYTLEHLEYVYRADLRPDQIPNSIQTSVNKEVYDFTNEDSEERDDKKVNILAIQIKYQAQHLTKLVLYTARISFVLYQAIHFWGIYLYFWHSSNPTLQKYIMIILVIGTYQYLEIYVIAVVICIFLPFYGLVQLIRMCFLKINSNKFIRLLKPKKFRASDVKGEHQCRVCLIPYTNEDKIITLPCNEMHHFHSFCIKTWLKVSITCPLCRESFANLTQDQVNSLMSEMN